MHRLVSTTAFLALVFGTACGNGEEEASGNDDNHAACVDFIEAYNDLPCVDDASEEDPEEECPDYDDTCDLIEYFACLAEGWECQDAGGVEVPIQTNSCDVPDCSGVTGGRW